MERRLVGVLGTAAKHIFSGLRHAIRAIALTFIIVAVIVAITTEVVAVILDPKHAFPPTGETHLAAAALAIAFAYAAAITVAMEELLRAMIKAIELIIEEAEKLEKKAAEEIGVLAREAEQEAVKLGRAAVTDAGHFGHTAINDAGALGRAVSGAAGGVVGGIEHDARAVGAHIPGVHHNNSVQAGSNTPTLPSADPAKQ